MAAVIVVRRRSGAEDADGIAALIRESNAYYAALAPEFFVPIDDDGLAEWIAGDQEWLAEPTNLALVAEVEEEVAGYLEASIRSVGPFARFSGNRDLREPSLSINALITAERHKRKGVGTRLVEAAEEWALEQGVTLAVCDTFLGSPQSVPFWEHRMGYERRSVNSGSHRSEDRR
jgi:GNAT superfamily N-acetyltransferase